MPCQMPVENRPRPRSIARLPERSVVRSRAGAERADLAVSGRRTHRRRWLNPLRALQLEQSTPGCAGSGSPPRTIGTGWSAASSPGRTGCGSRCQPGQCHPWTATWASTVCIASRRQALVCRTGWSVVRRKRLAKPGRPQRSQRRSFVVGQPQAPAWCSQPRQVQIRERAIHGSADLEQRRERGGRRGQGPQRAHVPKPVGDEPPRGRERIRRGPGDSSASGNRPVVSPELAYAPALDRPDPRPATDASKRAKPAYPSVALASGSVARSQQPAQMRIEARVLFRPPHFEAIVLGKAPSVPQEKHRARRRWAWAMGRSTSRAGMASSAYLRAREAPMSSGHRQRLLARCS